MTLSDFSKDKFVAPYTSQFTEAQIPDMSDHYDQSEYWVANYTLNCMCRGAFEYPHRQYLFNYLRRAEAAFLQHDQAREATINFLNKGGQSPSLYMRAITQWEYYLFQSYHCFNLARYIFGKKKIFEKGDGSIYERLNKLYNQSKHAESCMKHGSIPENGTIPVWLTNEGLSSEEATLAYSETADILEEIAEWAIIFEDPATMQEKLTALDE